MGEDGGDAVINSRYQRPVTCFHAKVVGATYDNRQDAIALLGVLERLDLVPEPDNRHDANAIKVCRRTGEQIGYLKRDRARQLVEKLKLGHRCFAFVKRVSGGETHYATVTVLVMSPGATDEQVMDWINRYDVLRGITISLAPEGLVASPAVDLVPDVAGRLRERIAAFSNEPGSEAAVGRQVWPIAVLVLLVLIVLAALLREPMVLATPTRRPHQRRGA